MSHHDDTVPEEAPPSYSEALKDQSILQPGPQIPSRPQESQSHLRPPQQPPRPPATPQRPSHPSSSHSSLHSQARPNLSNSSTASLYNGNQSLPFQYPRGNLCKKCKNTGFKLKNGEACRNCWSKYYLNKHAYNPNPNLPYKYPKGYLCEKCNNTGVKLKNGKSCKDCWEMFGPRNRVNYVPLGRTYGSHGMGLDGFFGGGSTPNQSTYVTAQPLFGPPPGQYGPPPGHFGPPPGHFGPPQGQFGPPPGSPLPPLRVAPGDPRIGGVLCGRCRGSGLVWSFLDEDLCPSCSGLGRIIH